MPAKRIATEDQRKKSIINPAVGTYLKVLASGGTRLKSRRASGPTWMRVKSERRPYQAPTVTSAHGCQTPLGSLVGPRHDIEVNWTPATRGALLIREGYRKRTGQRCPKFVPASLLVGVELNPGPPKGMKAKRAQAQNRKPRPTQRKQKRKQDSNRSVPRAPIGGSSKGSNRISRSLTVSEDEYIADVSLSSAGFTNLQYAVNPGNGVTFPWLSTIAANFNKYKFLKLKFYYKRIVSEFASAGDVGDIVLSLNPDASDPAPISQAQVYDLQMRDNAMPCENFALNKLSISELNKQDSYYVRVGAAPANTDIKTYDVGNLNLSTIGTATSGVCGKLFVSYTVLLHSPVLVQSLSGGVVHFSGIAATTANNFATATQQSGASPLLSGITLGTNTIVFPANVAGNYMVQVTINGGTSASAYTLSGGTPLPFFAGSGSRDVGSQPYSLAQTTSPTAAFSVYTVTIPVGGATITSSVSTIVGTGSVDVIIVSLPATVLTVDEKEQMEIDELRARADAADEKISRLMALLEPRGALGSQQTLSDDEDFQSASSSAAPGAKLSDSTLGLIGALISRKSNSHK
jgi:hypothetical protein